MSSFMVTTALVGSIVGQEAISEVSKSIFQSIAGIFYHTNPVVRELLEELDTYDEIDLIKSLIEEINKHTIKDAQLKIDIDDIMIKQSYNIIDDCDAIIPKENEQNVTKINTTAKYLSDTDSQLFPTILGEQQPFISDTLTKCLYQLKDILEKIYIEINKLNKGVEFHKKLWFQSFRTPAYLKNLDKIKKYQCTMNHKFEHLVKLMNIYLRLDYKLFNGEQISPNPT